MAALINVTRKVLRSLSEAEAPSSAKRNVSTDSTPLVEWRLSLDQRVATVFGKNG
jgi:hypothetical protein